MTVIAPPDAPPMAIADTRPATGRDRVAAFSRRHPYVTIFLVAMFVRLLLAVAVFVVNDGTLFLDDQTYLAMGRDAADGRMGAWSEYTAWLYDRTRTFFEPLTLVLWVNGSALAAQLYVAVLGALAAAATGRLAREVVSDGWVVVAGLMVALLPSQVVFSAVVLKDPMMWLLLVSCGIVAAVGARSAGWRLIACASSAVVLLVLIANLRPHTMVVVAWAFVVAALAGARIGMPERVALATASAIIVPLLLGWGVGGRTILMNTKFEERRELNAIGAASAIDPTTTTTFITTPVTEPVPSSDSVPGPPGDDVGPTTTAATPTAATPTVTTTTVAGRDPLDDARNAIGHLPRGLSVVLVEPAPWQSGVSRSLSVARAEGLLWYPILVLGLASAPFVLRRRQALAFPVVLIVGLSVGYGLSEGNIGTAFRHRGEVVSSVVVLATLGLANLSRRRRRTDAT